MLGDAVVAVVEGGGRGVPHLEQCVVVPGLLWPQIPESKGLVHDHAMWGLWMRLVLGSWIVRGLRGGGSSVGGGREAGVADALWGLISCCLSRINRMMVARRFVVGGESCVTWR